MQLWYELKYLDNAKKILCYCTVSIAGLIDVFLGGGGVTEKNYLYLGGRGKTFNDWGGHATF